LRGYYERAGFAVLRNPGTEVSRILVAASPLSAAQRPNPFAGCGRVFIPARRRPMAEGSAARVWLSMRAMYLALALMC